MAETGVAETVPRSAAVLGLRRAGGGIVRFLWPPHCLACDTKVGAEGGLCAECWSGLSLIERPYCERLGTPFAYDPGVGALSPAAIADPPPFGRLRAVARHDDVARKLVHALKYRDRLDLARWMAGWMGRSGAELVAGADLIVPIPLHRQRLWSRRFNQSAQLAAEIAKRAGKTFAAEALIRVKATRQQVGLSAAERARNVAGAFAIRAAQREALAGKRVVLVDDVFTTGETSKAATRVLAKAGAASVDVLVFALVVKE